MPAIRAASGVRTSNEGPSAESRGSRYRTGVKIAPFFGAVAVASWAACGHASTLGNGIYKCRGTGTAPVYQQQPCPDGTTLRDLVDDPATVSVIPFEGGLPAQPVKPPRAAKGSQPRSAPRPAKLDRRKVEAERRTSDAAVVERRHVKDGMSDGEVLARLGVPDLQTGKGGRRMRWTYMPAPADPHTVTQVHFVDGHVVAVDRKTMR
jgi:hypothetical protein